VIPDDTASLLRSPELGAPILEMGDVISESELRQLGQSIGALPQRPWEYRPDLPVGVSEVLSRMRYNRVEALSLGWGGKIDFGRLSADALVRIGVADWEPNFELGLTRPTTNARFRLGAYRRLAAANPDTKPFSGINSFYAFFAGRDDGQYFRTLGLELTGRNANRAGGAGGCMPKPRTRRRSGRRSAFRTHSTSRTFSIRTSRRRRPISSAAS